MKLARESATQILASYVAETEFDDLPDQVVDKAIGDPVARNRFLDISRIRQMRFQNDDGVSRKGVPDITSGV